MKDLRIEVVKEEDNSEVSSNRVKNDKLSTFANYAR